VVLEGVGVGVGGEFGVVVGTRELTAAGVSI